MKINPELKESCINCGREIIFIGFSPSMKCVTDNNHLPIGMEYFLIERWIHIDEEIYCEDGEVANPGYDNMMPIPHREWVARCLEFEDELEEEFVEEGK